MVAIARDQALAERGVALDRDGARCRRTASAGQHDVGLAGRCAASTVGSAGGSGSRSPRPASLTVNAIGSLPSTRITAVVPAGAPTFLPST